jgi:hypothetical protein
VQVSEVVFPTSFLTKTCIRNRTVGRNKRIQFWSSLFCDVTLSRLVVDYWRFGTAYLFHLQVGHRNASLKCFSIQFRLHSDAASTTVKSPMTLPSELNYVSQTRTFCIHFSLFPSSCYLLRGEWGGGWGWSSVQWDTLTHESCMVQLKLQFCLSSLTNNSVSNRLIPTTSEMLNGW